MAAYAAAVCLQKTINGLMNSTSPSSREMLELAYKEASSLLQVLEGLNGSSRSRSSMERVDALEGQIRDCSHKLKDVLEFREMKQLEEENGDVGAMGQEIRFFCEVAKRMRKEYLAELSTDDGNDGDEDTTTCFDFGVEMIGRSSLFDSVLKKVVCAMRPDDRYVFAFLGEEGSCSRVMVKTFFKNSHKVGKFERWGWVKVGMGCELKHVLMSLIAQVEGEHVDMNDKLLLNEDELSEYLCKALENRSYMIVLDGVDDVELLRYLTTKSFPDEGNGSVVLVTTTSPEVLRCADYWYNYEMANIFVEEMWFFIRHILFSEDQSIPAELEAAGKEILHNCGRKVMTIARTIVFLSKSDKTVEQWSKLAADKDNPIFTIQDEIFT